MGLYTHTAILSPATIATEQSTVQRYPTQRRQPAETLPYLHDVEDLPGGLLHLTHLVHEVPELGGAGHLVGREHLRFQ